MNTTIIALGWISVGLLTTAVVLRLAWAQLAGRSEVVPLVCELVALLGLLAYGRLAPAPLISFAALALTAGAVVRLSHVLQKHRQHLRVSGGDARVVRLRVLSTVLDNGDRQRIR
jgi:hypothetical protein